MSNYSGLINVFLFYFFSSVIHSSRYCVLTIAELMLLKMYAFMNNSNIFASYVQLNWIKGIQIKNVFLPLKLSLYS